MCWWGRPKCYLCCHSGTFRWKTSWKTSRTRSLHRRFVAAVESKATEAVESDEAAPSVGQAAKEREGEAAAVKGTAAADMATAVVGWAMVAAEGMAGAAEGMAVACAEAEVARETDAKVVDWEAMQGSVA